MIMSPQQPDGVRCYESYEAYKAADRYRRCCGKRGQGYQNYFGPFHVDAEMLCLAHWPVKHGHEIGDFLDESRRYVEQVDRLMLEALQQAKNGATMRDLMSELGPRLGDWPREADELLAFSFAGHLERFEGRGLVKRDSTSKPVRFSVI